jgi:arylformamidase
MVMNPGSSLETRIRQLCTLSRDGTDNKNRTGFCRNLSDESYLKAEGLSLTLIKGCVPVDGDTYDVPLQIQTVEQKRADRYKQKIGDADSQKDLSPVTHVAKGKNVPPFVILHIAEHPETKAQSQRLVKDLQEAGVPAKAYPAEGKTHDTLNDDLGLPDDKPTKALFEFVDGLLQKR